MIDNSKYAPRHNRNEVRQWCQSFKRSTGRLPTTRETADAFQIHTETARYHLKNLNLFQQPVKRRAIVYQFYVNYWRQYGYAPTYGEVSIAIGICENAVSQHVLKLIEQGLLEFDPKKVKRGIRLKGQSNNANV